MTLQYGEEKPSLEELAHHGVKGMKWGHRKKHTTQDILDARARQSARANELHRTADKLNLATAKNANSKEANNLAKKLVAQEKELNSNKDASVALRMTRGEKAVTLIIGGPFGAIAIGANNAIANKVEKNAAKRRGEK